MKKLFCVATMFIVVAAHGQQVVCNNKDVEKAFNLALQIVDANTKEGILRAGGDYGGEWTRDIAINSWNAASLLRPKVAEQSLWSVTIYRDTIGHQYWDKIIWVAAAFNHYKTTGDKAFLSKAYDCSVNTINELEQSTWDKKYQLFTGPSVFNDGIAGYPEPIFEPTNNSSYVLDHKGSTQIKCLSTNCIYYGAYKCLAEMAIKLGKEKSVTSSFRAKAANLKKSILTNLYDAKLNRLNYLIDQNGKVDNSQEALGISFAVLFGVIDGAKAKNLIHDAHVSNFGISSVYPDFKRFTADKPGRHNNIIWPMVNGFFSQAAIQTGNDKIFTTELMNLTHLALDADKGNLDFKEIYNPYSGKPDGGWQANGTDADHHWTSCKAQTWSATAYISMVLKGLVGININDDQLSIKPYLPATISYLELKNLSFRNAVLNIVIKGNGNRIKSFNLDGKPVKNYAIKSNLEGLHNIVIEMN